MFSEATLRMLERLYEAGIWPTRPDDPEAQQRFRIYTELFSGLVTRDPLREALGKKRISVLDIATGSGIAGIALALVLAQRGYKVDLALVDIRASDLRYARIWLSTASVEVAGRVLIHEVVCEAKRISHCLRHKYDIVVMMGNNMPHFSPWDAVQLFVGVRVLQPPRGVLIVEQHDIGAELLLTGSYQRVLSTCSLR